MDVGGFANLTGFTIVVGPRIVVAFNPVQPTVDTFVILLVFILILLVIIVLEVGGVIHTKFVPFVDKIVPDAPVPFDSVNNFVNAVLKLIDKQDLTIKYGRSRRLRIENEYSLNLMFQNYNNLLMK